MYAIYHGPEGLKDIATRIHKLTLCLGNGEIGTSEMHFRLCLDSLGQLALPTFSDALLLMIWRRTSTPQPCNPLATS
jgi:hypothetical protein